MQASVGDQLHIRSKTVGAPDRVGTIIEVRGKTGEPPYVVRFPDGHESLIFPGPDCVIESKQAQPTP